MLTCSEHPPRWSLPCSPPSRSPPPLPPSSWTWQRRKLSEVFLTHINTTTITTTPPQSRPCPSSPRRTQCSAGNSAHTSALPPAEILGPENAVIFGTHNTFKDGQLHLPSIKCRLKCFVFETKRYVPRGNSNKTTRKWRDRKWQQRLNLPPQDSCNVKL